MGHNPKCPMWAKRGRSTPETGRYFAMQQGYLDVPISRLSQNTANILSGAFELHRTLIPILSPGHRPRRLGTHHDEFENSRGVASAVARASLPQTHIGLSMAHEWDDFAPWLTQ